jgi:hypothetical protein
MTIVPKLRVLEIYIADREQGYHPRRFFRRLRSKKRFPGRVSAKLGRKYQPASSIDRTALN